MKLHNKSEFHKEIYSLSYTDLFFPLFDLISMHRKNLIDIQKIGPNSSLLIVRGGSRTASIYKMEYFVIIVNGWKPLTIITKRSTLDVAAVPDPSLIIYHTVFQTLRGPSLCDI